MSWQSANEAFRTEWGGPPRLPYSDEPAGYPCPMCSERFFTDEILADHERCHRGRTMIWKRHGTEGRYQQGCSCDPCKRAHADHNAVLNVRRKARQAVYETRPNVLSGRPSKVRVS